MAWLFSKSLTASARLEKVRPLSADLRARAASVPAAEVAAAELPDALLKREELPQAGVRDGAESLGWLEVGLGASEERLADPHVLPLEEGALAGGREGAGALELRLPLLPPQELPVLDELRPPAELRPLPPPLDCPPPRAKREQGVAASNTRMLVIRIVRLMENMGRMRQTKQAIHETLRRWVGFSCKIWGWITLS